MAYARGRALFTCKRRYCPCSIQKGLDMAFTKKTVRDIDVDGKRVLVRVDFNVPIKDGVVGDTTRIKAALPTINYLVEHNARVILMSHLGRPDGTGFQAEFSLEPVAAKLAELSGLDVTFVDDTYGEKAAAAVEALEPGKVLVLENVRFDKREKKNDPEIAKTLASYGDVFVLDAFGTAHRSQGSVVGPAAYLPAVAGFLLEKEVDTLTGIFAAPERPFVAIVGGSKVSSKIGVLDHLIDSADTLIIGGGMAYTFFLAKGYKTVGTSLKEEDWVERAARCSRRPRTRAFRFCFRSTTSLPTTSVRTLPAKSSLPTPSPRTAWAWTSVPRPRHCTPRPSRRQDRVLERPHGRLRVR